MVRQKIVGVAGDAQGRAYGFLFLALSKIYPVEFREITSRGFDTLDALIVLDGNIATGLEAADAGVPSYVAMGGVGEPARMAAVHVRFSSSKRNDVYLRNQTLIAGRELEFRRLVLQSGDDLLVSEGDRPSWIARPTKGADCNVVATPPPALRNDEFLFQYLNARRFMGLLPLMSFLREQVADIDWEGPPPRACFVFDDPSFYLRSYGYLNFGQLAEHATRHNYYASVATIPLDTWWVNREVAEILQSSSPRLSVLVHGNNHTRDEMNSARNQINYLALAGQAMRRMERLVNRRGISFVKVMEAPYGTLASSMFHHLLRLGYEGALCTTELLLRHNASETWPAAFGMDRSEMLGGGLPVIPRIRMTADWKNDVLLAAFLRQPIVLAGHHHDAAGGMRLMKEFAETVNRLENVCGSDLEGILRTNYKQKVRGTTLVVRMYSRRLSLRIPPGIDRLEVHRPWLDEGRIERLVISVGKQARFVRNAGSISDEIILPNTNDSVEIASEVDNPLDLASFTFPSAGLWPIARKIMKEVRDRSAILLQTANLIR